MFPARYFGARYYPPRYFGKVGADAAIQAGYFGHRYFGARHFAPRYFSPTAAAPPTTISAALFITEQDDRILASAHRNSYIPNPTERGHYTSGPPRPWLRRFDRVDN